MKPDCHTPPSHTRTPPSYSNSPHTSTPKRALRPRSINKEQAYVTPATPMSIETLIAQQQAIKLAHRQNYRLLREVAAVAAGDAAGVVNRVMESMDQLQGHLMQVEKAIYHLEYRERRLARKSNSGHKTSREDRSRILFWDQDHAESDILPRIKQIKKTLFNTLHHNYNHHQASSSTKKAFHKTEAQVQSQLPKKDYEKQNKEIGEKLIEAESHIRKMEDCNLRFEMTIQQLRAQLQQLKSEKQVWQKEAGKLQETLTLTLKTNRKALEGIAKHPALQNSPIKS